jgi:ABC-2 type transport system permease protein
MSLGPLLRKELGEIFREKRFVVFGLAYTILLGLISFFVVRDIQSAALKGPNAVVPAALGIAVPLYFVNVLALVLLTATFVYDAVGKERDAGMLALLLTSPASPGSLLAAKVALGSLVYLFTALLALALGALLGLALGPIVPVSLLLFFLSPLLVLYVFLLGTGLLFSVLAPSSRLAIALGLGVHFPLFLLGATPVFAGLLAAAPAVKQFLDWTPFAVASAGLDAVVYGDPVPWTKYAVTLAIGLGSLVAAFVVFRRQEVVQG